MATKSAALKKDTGTSKTTALAVKKTGGAMVDIAAIKAKLKEQADAMADRTAPPTGRKIMPGNDKMFKLPDGSKVPELKVCIVEFVTVHNFYERAFDPKNIMAPGCFAVGLNPKQMEPVAESPNRQAANCQDCPMNVFGSDGDGKACKNGRRLALLPLNDAGDDVDAEADMLILDVSPTALKGFDGYVQGLQRSYQLPPAAFITTVTLDPNTEYAKVQFADPQPVTSLGEVVTRQDEARELLYGKPDFSTWQPVTPPKGRGAAAPAKAGARR